MPRRPWTPSPRQQRWLAALLAAAVGLAFLVGAFREAFLCDDAFISFRYARNLVEGLGLVWNPGERVEGYTNFLWVMVLAGGMVLGAAPELLAPALGIVCGGGVLGLVAWLGAREHGWRDPLVWLAPAALALNRSFLAWSTGGLETQLFSLLVLGGMVALLGERRREAAVPWRAPALFALATLTRPDGVVFAAVAGGAWALDVQRRRRGLGPVMAWAGVYALPVAVHVLWRRAYYGEWVPNTFHAKVSGFRWEDGAHYLAYFATSYQLPLLVGLAVVAVAVRRGFREGLFSAVIGVVALYLASIGGDFLEFRFLVPLMPYLYWLMADGVRVLREQAVRAPRRRWWAGPAAAVAAVALLAGTGISPVRWMEPAWFFEEVETSRRYVAHRIEQGRILAELVERGALPADLRIATGGLGALSYYTGWFVIDHHGLTDRYVARLPPTNVRLGHEKSVPVAYLRERDVAAVLLSQSLVVPRSGPIGSVLATSKKWLDVYNSRVEDPVVRLRPRCYEVVPGMVMIFGTNLDEAAERRIFGHLTPCAPPAAAPG